ncbi:MAG: hypothetical protein IJM81_04680, partial [Prevotella sp.]|nr:hypothetical protein [Prevotella sp.]
DELARMPRRENGLMKSNVFDKPRADELARMPRRENVGAKKPTFFQITTTVARTVRPIAMANITRKVHHSSLIYNRRAFPNKKINTTTHIIHKKSLFLHIFHIIFAAKHT